MFKALMTSRRFAPLFWCQFCSALNDNFLKNALVMLILFGIGGMATATGSYAPVLVTLAGVVFIAPFFILSALGGELADRYDKAQVASYIKLAEIPIAALAALGFFLHSVPILFVTLGLFGIIAALFGPVKYGILPEKLETAELPAGNALVEGATFLAILIGTIAGGVAVTSASPELVVGVILALAVASWGFAARDTRRRAGGAWAGHHAQRVDLDAHASARGQSGCASLVWRAHRFVVLARRLGGAGAAAGHGQGPHRRQRRRGDAGPRHLRDRHSHRIDIGRSREPRRSRIWRWCRWARR